MVVNSWDRSSIVARLHERAQHHPERVALTFWDDRASRREAFSYGHLHERASVLAARLLDRAAPGERVQLFLPSGPGHVTACLGCLYAGAVAMPTPVADDAPLPHPAQLVAIVRDARARVVVTELRWVDALVSACRLAPELHDVEVIAIDDVGARTGSGVLPMAGALLLDERVPVAPRAGLGQQRTPKLALSVVVPAYKSQDCLVELAARVGQVCRAAGESYELVLVNDGSPDQTWDVIAQLALSDPAVVGINLRKNFGQDNAIMAGLNAARGEAVVIMDDDLQHDPADLPALLAKLREGHDVVYANYAKTHQKAWKNLGSWFNGKVAEVVLDKPPEVYLSPYKVMTAAVVDEIVRYRGPYPYVDGLLFRTTSRMAQVPVHHHARFGGTSTYSFWKSVAVWARLSTNFSVVPLRVATVLGALIATIGFVLAAAFLTLRLTQPEIAQSAVGWASVVVSVLVLGGLQLVTLGVLGEYVGRMHLNLNNRPQYIVREQRRTT